MFAEGLTRDNEFKLHQGRFGLGMRENFLQQGWCSTTMFCLRGPWDPHHRTFLNLRKVKCLTDITGPTFEGEIC